MKIINNYLLIIFIIAFYSCSTIKPEAPLASKEVVSAPPSILSNLNIPVEVDLNSYFLIAEKSVPSQFEGSD